MEKSAAATRLKSVLAMWWSRLLCVAALGAVSRAAEEAAAAPSCALEAYDPATLPVLAQLLKSHLTPKHSKQMLDVMNDPCDKIKQGIIMNSFKLKNTKFALAKFVDQALRDLEPDRVANFWELVPGEPRLWMLKAFITSLPCKVDKATQMCTEESTNEVLALFDKARTLYAKRALVAKGLEPFPADEEDEDDKETSDDDAAAAATAGDVVTRYASRLGIDGAAVDWLKTKFEPTAEQKAANPNATIAEPTWFRSISIQCRQRASLYAPSGDKVSEDTSDMANLDSAVSTQLWAWYYKQCHKASVENHFEHKDDPKPAEEGAVDGKGAEL